METDDRIEKAKRWNELRDIAQFAINGGDCEEENERAKRHYLQAIAVTLYAKTFL